MKSRSTKSSSASSSVLTICDGSRPLQIAGRARTMIKLLMQRRRARTSSAGLSRVDSIFLGCRVGPRTLLAPPFAKLTQKLVWRYEERIFLQNSIDDDQWMRTHY